MFSVYLCISLFTVILLKLIVSSFFISDNAKHHAEQMRDKIRDAIGLQNFIQVYSLIKKTLKTKRDKRKQGEKIMAVVNPMRNAKRKLRIAEKHKVNKKRKIMTMKFGRWSH